MKTALLLETDKALASVLKAAIEEFCQVKVLVASSKEVAAKFLDSFKVDYFLVDYWLDIIPIGELTKKAKNLWNSECVVFMSGKDGEDFTFVDQIVKKPFSVEDLECIFNKK